MMRRPPITPLFPYTTLFRSLLLETQQDTLNVKAAAIGVRRAMREAGVDRPLRSEEHTSELQSHHDLVCRLLLEKKNRQRNRAVATRQARRRGMCDPGHQPRP